MSNDSNCVVKRNVVSLQHFVIRRSAVISANKLSLHDHNENKNSNTASLKDVANVDLYTSSVVNAYPGFRFGV